MLTLPAGHACAPAPLPRHPTAHPPGSPEKLAVLRGRWSRGESLFHPLDATLDGHGPGALAPHVQRHRMHDGANEPPAPYEPHVYHLLGEHREA